MEVSTWCCSPPAQLATNTTVGRKATPRTAANRAHLRNTLTVECLCKLGLGEVQGRGTRRCFVDPHAVTRRHLLGGRTLLRATVAPPTVQVASASAPATDTTLQHTCAHSPRSCSWATWQWTHAVSTGTNCSQKGAHDVPHALQIAHPQRLLSRVSLAHPRQRPELKVYQPPFSFVCNRHLATQSQERENG